MEIIVVTPKFRVQYPKIFTPGVKYQSQEAEYSITAIFPKATDLSKIRDAVEEIATKEFGPKATRSKTIFIQDFKSQNDKVRKNKETGEILLQDGKPVYLDGYEHGGFYATFKCAEKPKVVEGYDPSILITDPSQFYAGCYAHARIKIFSYNKVAKGVSWRLESLQKAGNGKPLFSGPISEEHFTAVEMDDVDDLMG